MTTKLMVLADAGCTTGFARITKGVMDYLHGTGRYDIQVRGINFRPNHNVAYEYEVEPVTPEPAKDPIGMTQIEGHIAEIKPDCLFVVQDLWNVTGYMTRKPPELPTVVYFPIDCPNIKWGHSVVLGAASEAVTYTHFAAREATASVQEGLDMLIESSLYKGVKPDFKATWFHLPMQGMADMPCRIDRLSRLQNTANWNVIPHGMDLEMFRPGDRAAAREFYGIKEQAFVIGAVGTNQFRKRWDLTIRAFAAMAERWPAAVLLIHCMGGDSMQGWDLAQLCRYYGVENRVRLVHQLAPVLSDENLVALYNTFDVQINTAGGEGWGLPSFEGAACGVPQLVPDWSATRELWKCHGVLLPVKDYRMEPKLINTAHASIDVEAAAAQLLRFAEDPELRAEYGAKARKNAERQRSWDQVAVGFDQLIARAMAEGAPLPMSFNDVRAERHQPVLSELANRPVL